MIRIIRGFLFAFLLIALFYGNINAQKEVTYQSVYSLIKNIEIDTSKIYTVDNVTINKEYFRAELTAGKIFFCVPVNGKTHHAIFLGKGKYHYETDNQVEAEHLYRFYKDKKVAGNVETIMLSFADSTYENIASKCRKCSGNDPDVKAAYAQLKKNIGYMIFDDYTYYPTNQMKAILEKDANGFFYAQFKDANGKLLQYEFDPYSEESVTLSYCQTTIFKKYSEVINSLPSGNAEINNSVKAINFIRINSYRINSLIESQLFFTSCASIKLTPNLPRQQWLNFSLHKDLIIDSIKVDGVKISNYFKDKDNDILWMSVSAPMAMNKEYAVDVYYKGRIMSRDTDGWVSNKAYDNWYPRTFSKDKADYEMTFKYPDNMKLCAVGDLIESKEDGGYIISRWAAKNPVKNVSFNIGVFNEFNLKDKELPSITVYNYQNGHRGASSSMNEVVGEEVLNCIRFYSFLFGKPGFQHIYATEIAADYGEAFEGLVNYSPQAFQSNDSEGYTETFRAHEVAHQWWGIGTGYKTYRDQWLSEAFAEYSSLMYYQAKSKDNQKFLDLLRKYKELIYNNRKYLFETGVEAGPICLGVRTSGHDTPNDYDLIIYRKGAWALHMLRMLMIDLKTMSDDAFNNMMKDFYTTYKGTNTTTENFKSIVEKHIGKDMSWFFNQWIYGTYLPAINYGYNIQEENGKYRVILKASVEDAPDGFQLYVPLLIKFGSDKFVRLRAALKGRNSVIKLPLLPLKPEEIVFNDMESVLCAYDKVDFEKLKF